MKLFVGLDVSLEKTSICVVSEHGKIVREAQAASEPDALTRWMGDVDGTDTVRLTAGRLGGHRVSSGAPRLRLGRYRARPSDHAAERDGRPGPPAAPGPCERGHT